MIVSALLSSESRPAELHSIAEALQSDANFRGRLAFAVHQAAEVFYRPTGGSTANFTLHDILADEDPVSAGLRLVKNRRMSKSEVLKRLRTVSERAADFFEDKKNASVREILTTFSLREPEQKMRAFLAALAGPGEPDEYLKGILR